MIQNLKIIYLKKMRQSHTDGFVIYVISGQKKTKDATQIMKM